MIYGYIRVSTDKQSLENQEFEISNFYEKQGLKIDKWITETISGTKDFEKRKLGKVLKKLKSGDILICSEVSRLGRNLLQIMTILNICMRKDTQVWTIKDKSGQVRRERKSFRDHLLMLLNAGDTQDKLCTAILQKALNGDIKAFEVIRDTIGEKPNPTDAEKNTIKPVSLVRFITVDSKTKDEKEMLQN